MSSNPILEAALQYAGRGWRVIPLYGLLHGVCTCKLGTRCESPGKHPAIKAGKAFENASSDPRQCEKWFSHAKTRNIGIATGRGLAVVDLDGPAGLETLRAVTSLLPRTLVATTGRGAHLYFSVDGPAPTNSGAGLDIRGDGGMVVAPPSQHISGRAYAWASQAPLAGIPEGLLTFFRSRRGESRTAERSQRQILNQSISSAFVPAYLRGLPSASVRLADRAAAGIDSPPLADLVAVARIIPNPDCGWDEWNRLGMAFYRASEGSDDGLEAFCQWSEKSKKYDEDTCLSRWEAYDRSPPDSIGFGTLVFEAKKADPGFILPSNAQKTYESYAGTEQTESAPGNSTNSQNTMNGAPNDPFADLKLEKNALISLQDLNKKHAVISNVGGKCLVMHFIPNPINRQAKIPNFQTFKAFSERYMNRTVTTWRDDHGVQVKKVEPLATTWLKWRGHAQYEGIELDPQTAARRTPNDYYNLWSGFGVEPKPGNWDLLKAHITNVVASGDPTSALYILRWAAWAVQHPGEPAEAALVIRGKKAAGKGAFARTLLRLFGTHGRHIRSRHHLVGNFNAHLRDCLLLYADEAYWAGDKQGESALKGLITEPTIPIEQKGVDVIDWPNQLHIVMTANDDWVVPASADERRYAVFDINESLAGDPKHFEPLWAEIKGEGPSAMLHDLLRVDLGDWHPRKVIRTQALQKQKQLSLGPLDEWWLELLENGHMPDGEQSSQGLYDAARRDGLPQWITRQKFGRFLADCGCLNSSHRDCKFWIFPEINKAREKWEKKHGWKNW